MYNLPDVNDCIFMTRKRGLRMRIALLLKQHIGFKQTGRYEPRVQYNLDPFALCSAVVCVRINTAILSHMYICRGPNLISAER